MEKTNTMKVFLRKDFNFLIVMKMVKTFIGTLRKDLFEHLYSINTVLPAGHNIQVVQQNGSYFVNFYFLAFCEAWIEFCWVLIRSKE